MTDRTPPSQVRPGTLGVLGSTGSIGTQTLDLVRRNPDQFRVATLAARASGQLLVEQAREFKPQLVAVADPDCGREVQAALGSLCEVVIGPDAAVLAAAHPSVHTTVAAMVGFSALEPVIAAIEHQKQVALANKEVMVAAGPLIRKLLANSKTFIAPLDSEHNALFQCLLGRGVRGLRRVTITASGGPFCNESLERLAAVTPQEAIKHPRWNMGPKISIDSASLMNKGLEVLEAAMLFELQADQIEVLIHPQSIVHGFVEYEEGSALAVLYHPDMRIPIAFALSYLNCEDPRVAPGNVPVNSGTSFLDLAGAQKLEFSQPDLERFPGLKLCYDALRVGKTMPAVLNAANEVAVQAFIDGTIGFLEMAGVVAASMSQHQTQEPETIDIIQGADAEARQLASKYIETLSSQSPEERASRGRQFRGNMTDSADGSSESKPEKGTPKGTTNAMVI